jgi:hypothetical protein
MARIRVIAEAPQPEPPSEVRCEDCRTTIKVHRDRSNLPTRCKSCRAVPANDKRDAKAMPTPSRGSPPP